MRWSRRVPRDAPVNRLTLTLERLRAARIDIADLTESNPTRVGLHYPSALLSPLADARALTYTPSPLGLPEAREAIAADCVRRGANVAPGRVVVTASTSESYSWLFKLLCDPGDTVLVPAPSYPLFEFLALAEGVTVQPYALRFHGRWEVDWHSVSGAPPSTRAIVVVSPNNPTGSYLSHDEVAKLRAICLDRGWALVADEVFADYPLDVDGPPTDLALSAPVPTFSLGGASKALGLPQVKLGWMVVGGPDADCHAALHGLELIADTYLSVGTPVQTAAPVLLREAAVVREQIHARVRRNLSHAQLVAARHLACTLLPVEGGWTAVVRVPAVRSEETLLLELLEREHILVHPGYFFDFPHEAFLVVSLLPDERVFSDAFERALHFACSPS